MVMKKWEYFLESVWNQTSFFKQMIQIGKEFHEGIEIFFD